MTYFTVEPSDALKPYIKYIWIHEEKIRPDSPFTFYATADAFPKLLFHYYGEFDDISNEEVVSKSPKSFLQGPTRRYGKYITYQDIGILGVFFYPSAIPALFDNPIAHFLDRVASLHLLSSFPGIALQKSIAQATDNNMRLEILQQTLIEILSRQTINPDPLQELVLAMIKQNHTLQINELADKNGLSERQIQRRFKSLFGFSPKVFDRIIRFEHAISKHAKEDISLTSLAHELGYYDQSHFIRDFREFSGQHPSAYFKLAE